MDLENGLSSENEHGQQFIVDRNLEKVEQAAAFREEQVDIDEIVTSTAAQRTTSIGSTSDSRTTANPSSSSAQYSKSEQQQGGVEEEEEHFTNHEFGEQRIQYLDKWHDDDPHFRQQLFCDRIRPRQFFIGSVLYRESKARKVRWDELFLDLTYVAIVANLSHSVKISKISWVSVLDVILIFVPVWNSWISIVGYMNRFGRDDTAGRMGLYLSMVLVFGMGLNAENCFNADPAVNTANLFIGTYMVLFVLYRLVHVYHAIRNPDFANFIWVLMITPTVTIIPYFASVFVPLETDTNFVVKRVLWFVAYVLDVSVWVFNLTVVMDRFRKYFEYRVAMNIEHWVERVGLFVIIVCGEFVVSILLTSNINGFTFLYLDAVLGLCIGISFEWLYFYLLDGYGGRFIHPLRYKSGHGMFWSLFHMPLCAAIIISSVGIGILITYNPDLPNVGSNDLEKKYGYQNVLWLTGGGIASFSFIASAIGSLYHVREDHNHDHGSARSITDSNMSLDGTPGMALRKIDSTFSGSNVITGSSTSMSTLMGKLRKKIGRNPQPHVCPGLPDHLRIKSPETPSHLLVPRFPKYVRLSIRVSVGLLVLLVTGLAYNLSINAYLGIIATIQFLGVFLEEFGKIRVKKSDSSQSQEADTE